MLEFAFVVVLAAQYAGTTPIYRWVDDQGTLHLSDRPPPDRDLEPIPRPRDNVVDSWRNRPSSAAAKGRKKPTLNPVKQSPRKDKAQQCQRARELLDKLMYKRRSGYKASEGRKLKQDIRKTQSEVRSLCGTWR